MIQASAMVCSLVRAAQLSWWFSRVPSIFVRGAALDSRSRTRAPTSCGSSGRVVEAAPVPAFGDAEDEPGRLDDLTR